MQLTLIAVVFLALIALAYRLYGSWISRLDGARSRRDDAGA